jgi:hypothetical protein
MAEAIPTLQRKTSKLEFGTSCTAHMAKISRTGSGRKHKIHNAPAAHFAA